MADETSEKSNLLPIHLLALKTYGREDHEGLKEGYRLQSNGEVEFRTSHRWQQYTATELDWIARGCRDAAECFEPEKLDQIVKKVMAQAMERYIMTQQQECPLAHCITEMFEVLNTLKGE